MSNMRSLEDFLMDELKDLYISEEHLIKILPEIILAVSRVELKKTFEDLLNETVIQKDRFNNISKLAGNRELTGNTCKVTEQLIEDVKVAVGENCTPEVKDIVLIATAQKIYHHKIAIYGIAKTHARILGYTEVEELLETTEKEVISTDKLLNTFAKGIKSETMDPV